MSDPTPLSTQFPNTQPWPVKPPDEHWLKRWHWLQDQDLLLVAEWHWNIGWHFGHSGRPDPDDLAGMVYIAPAEPPRPPVATGWAVQLRDGEIIVDCRPDITEARIWEIATGWGDAEDIEWNKSRGARAFRVEVREI